jgi:hypothetical protein
MRKNLLTAAFLISAYGAFGQGTVFFSNRNTSDAPPQQPLLVAPIFGVDAACPTCEKHGNPTSTWNGTSGPTPAPAGTQVYGGAPIAGTGFTVQLWAVNAQQPDSALAVISTTTMTTRSQVNYRGFINQPTVNPAVPNAVGNTSDRAKFEVRVWDNQGGQITDWAQVLANPNVARGMSGIFTVDLPLGVGSTAPAALVGLQSFQLFTVVPEPSVIALGVLGAGCLFLLRRRK